EHFSKAMRRGPAPRSPGRRSFRRRRTRFAPVSRRLATRTRISRGPSRHSPEIMDETRSRRRSEGTAREDETESGMDALKVHLTEEKETLLITLYARALDSRRKPSLLDDKAAEEIVGRIDYGFDKLKLSTGDCFAIVIRAKHFDTWT